jgi:hypothetical protein
MPLPFSELSIQTYRLVIFPPTVDTRPIFSRNPIPAVRTKLAQRYFTVDSFSYSASWQGASFMIARGTFGVPYYFTLNVPVTPPSTSFIPCVSWVVGLSRVRYKLFSNGTEVLPYPLYSGQAIIPGAMLEIWTVQSSSPSLSSAWNLLCGNLVVPDSCLLSPSTGGPLGEAGVSSPTLSPYPYQTLDQLFSG